MSISVLPTGFDHAFSVDRRAVERIETHYAMDKVPAQDGKKKRLWASTPTPNLIKYIPKGSYYMRARVGGTIRRESLHSVNYIVAKFRLGERLQELRQSDSARSDAPETLWQALCQVRLRIKADPSIKESTRLSYIEEINSMGPGWIAEVPRTPLRALNAQEMAQWWQRAASVYAPQRANHLLMFVRRAIARAQGSGALFRNPALDLKPVKIPRTRLELPTVAELRAIVSSVRSQRKAYSEESANWIEFAAFSGMRPAEIAALEWKHVDASADLIHVHGGAQGTKNRESRAVPVIAPMAELLARMSCGIHHGLVFSIKKPTLALRGACLRLQRKRMRIYDLRHVFASICSQSGVPVPTFAKWMGHKDGGTLAMKTYVHASDQHSREAAKLVKF